MFNPIGFASPERSENRRRRRTCKTALHVQVKNIGPCPIQKTLGRSRFLRWWHSGLPRCWLPKVLYCCATGKYSSRSFHVFLAQGAKSYNSQIAALGATVLAAAFAHLLGLLRKMLQCGCLGNLCGGSKLVGLWWLPTNALRTCS